jgi:hypothetical protein
VAGEHLCTVGDAHFLRISEHGQHAANMPVSSSLILP